MICDELEFQNLREIFPKREIEKRMFLRVVKRSLDSFLSYVFMTDVFHKLSLALCKPKEKSLEYPNQSFLLFFLI